MVKGIGILQSGEKAEKYFKIQEIKDVLKHSFPYAEITSVGLCHTEGNNGNRWDVSFEWKERYASPEHEEELKKEEEQKAREEKEKETVKQKEEDELAKKITEIIKKMYPKGVMEE